MAPPLPAPSSSTRPTATSSVRPTAAPGWVRRRDAPVALTEVGAAAYGRQLWVVGGFDRDVRATQRVLVYDPRTDMWHSGPDLPVAVQHAAVVSTGSDLYVLGGYLGSTFQTPTTDVWRLDLAGSRWVHAPRLPEPRAAGAAAWDGQWIVYGGGMGPEGVSDGVYALKGDAWRRLGRLSAPREHLAAASNGAGLTWFLGGRDGSLATNLSTIDLVDHSGIRAVGRVPTARGGVAAFWSPATGACLIGGERTGATLDAVECIASDGRSVIDAPLLVPRHGLGAGVIDGVAYAVLGGRQPGLTVSSVIEALELRR